MLLITRSCGIIIHMNFLKKHKYLTVAILLFVGLGAYVATRPEPSPYETVSVAQGDVIQKVSVTGKVNSESEVNLAFEVSGRVSSEPLSVGTRVAKGDTIVRLDASELSSLRAQAIANLEYEESRLVETQKGARPEEIAVYESQLESAGVAYHDALLALSDKLTNAYTTANDALYNKVDHLLQNPRTTHPLLDFPLYDLKSEGEILRQRILLEETFSSWQKVEGDPGLLADPEERLSRVMPYLASMKTYLDALAAAVNGLTTVAGVTQATIDSWKLDVSSARSAVNSAITLVVTGEQSANTAHSAFKVAEQQLTLKRAGATPESITAQKAKIASVRASVANYDVQIGKRSLVAPFDGTVTRQEAKMGQSVAPNQSLVTMMGDGAWKIETNVPEVDVAKVALNDSAEITLDAYGPDVRFRGTVSFIDPAETVLEGVSTYKVTMLFNEKDERVRSGMTANIDIMTDKREGVLTIPGRAVFTKEGKKYVRILVVRDGKEFPEEREVELGLRGSDGAVEVLRGITSGERVVIFEKK